MAPRQTKRQRECARIASEKAKRMRRRQVVRRCVLLVGGIALLYAAGGGFWFVHSGRAAEFVENRQHDFYALTADAGFTIKNVYLDGRQHTSMDKINNALGIERGMSIFETSPAELKSRLENIDRVAAAEVERVLPDTLHVRIIEREPVAIWQNKGALRLIDPQGKVMEDLKVEAYAGLPVLVGEDAASNAEQLFTFLLEEKELAKQVESAIRIGERRWNVRLKNGIEVKLPETAPGEAWKELARMQAEDKVLERAIVAIDMRLAGKIFLKMNPSQTAQPAENISTPASTAPRPADMPNAKET